MILHGSWIISGDNHNEFIFWGEDGKTLFKRKGRTGHNSLPIYDKLVKEKELEEILTIPYKESSIGVYNLEELENGEFEFIQKEIRGISFSCVETLKILLSIEEKFLNNEEIKLSEELIYWIKVAKLSSEFIIKHKYYPSLIKNKNEIVSRWSWYTINVEDIRRINVLKKNMPPYCKAYFSINNWKSSLENSKNDFKYIEGKNFLYSFINWLIDGFVRKSIEDCAKLCNNKNLNNLALNWFKSLSVEEGSLNISFDEKKQLIEEYNKWIQPLRQIEKNANFRTCFKISAPDNEKELWLVEYVLQSMDDLSLILPASMVWKEKREEITFLNRKFQNPQERLLQDLANAARIYPTIEKSLYYASPIGFKLSIGELYSFFEEEAYILEEAGFGIIAPSWWKRPSQLSVSIKSENSSETSKLAVDSKFGLDTVLDYDWKLSLGDEELSLEEFKKLSKLKVPLVQIRGQWVQINPEQIKSFQKFLKKSQEKIKLGEILRLQLSNEDVVPGIAVREIKNNDIITEFIEHLSDFNKLKETKTSTNFQGVLRKYQEIGVSWLVFLRKYGLGACLADDMGLGKTIQTICLLLYERENKWTDKPTLLICPTSVVGNWKKEMEKFAPSLSVMIHHGTKRIGLKEFEKEAEKYDLVITTYALTVKDESAFSKVKWTGIVIDEAQNIKNTASKQTQAIKRLEASYRIALTGTPVENRLSDLWSIFDFINPGYLYNWGEFKNRYAVPIEKNKNIKRGEQLKKIISPFVLRRLKSDPSIIQDLPDKIETKDYSNLTKEQATLYQAIVNDMVEKIEDSEGIERKGAVLATLTKLKQICNHPAQFLKDNSSIKGRSGKLERLIELLEELTSEGDRALVFTQFSEMGDILQREIQKQLGVQTLFLHGGTSRKKREEMINTFQEDGDQPMIFILSLKAGGVGLNLTKANHVFHFDRWWNPAVENQATDRAYRIGQKKNVQVHKFVCVGTLEEKIDKMIEEKQALADSIVGSSENWISEMSNEDLRELFNLSDTE